MATLDEWKVKWSDTSMSSPGGQAYDQKAFEKIFRGRVKKQINTSFQYFWASFVLQVLVYSLLSHVIIKYAFDPSALWLGIAGILLYLPFTVVLMKKFKQMAIARPIEKNDMGVSLHEYVLLHHSLLKSFYRFKSWYEFLLVPLSSAIGVILTFKIYVPGGVPGHLTGALITFIIALLSCFFAVRSENKKRFEEPLHQLQEIIREFEN